MNRYCYKKLVWPFDISNGEVFMEVAMEFKRPAGVTVLLYTDATIEAVGVPRSKADNRSLTNYIVDGGLIKRFLGVKE